VPISLYRIPSQLHQYLKYYKTTTHPSREQFEVRVAALLAYFLRLHGRCVASAAGEDWDILTIVPSTSGRPGVHPLAQAIARVATLDHQYERLLTRGPAVVGHNQANDDAFRLRRQLAGERVLVIDDTFTSGARAQSAASAINLSGGVTVAVLAIGRMFDPGFSDDTADYWAAQSRARFDWATCCIH
jgi:adenine/guanine phosphoribosyltransferase-like PRPP-binding protein